jgi:dipeptidyl aminopeptidase/acylaminoacyl peptidase
MTVIRVLSFVIATGLCVSVSRADEASSLEVAVTREGDCFRYDSYENWAEFIRSRQQGSGGPAVPKEEYDLYRESIDCSFFSYTVDGVEVAGFSARPKVAAGKKLPAVIYNRGGNSTNGSLTFGTMFEGVFPLASQGFFVIGSQYREKDEFGGRDVDDVLALIAILDRRDDVAGDRIGMLGRSRGGIMTMLAGARSSRIKAMILIGTPADLEADLSVRPDMERVYERLIPGYAANKRLALQARSPLFIASKLASDAPILILHGDADDRARVTHALQLAAKLQELKRPHKLVIYPNGDHSLRDFRAEVRGEISAWFEAHLKAGDRP